MPLELIVATPEGQAFHGEVEAVALPGSEGEFEVLPGHEALLSGLHIGEMQIHRPGEILHAALGRGFAEVHDDKLTVLVASCEFANEIDRERAELARERARRQLDEMRHTVEGEATYQEYQDAYSRAIARIAVSDRFKH